MRIVRTTNNKSGASSSFWLYNFSIARRLCTRDSGRSSRHAGQELRANAPNRPSNGYVLFWEPGPAKADVLARAAPSARRQGRTASPSSPACGSREVSEECRSEFVGIGGQRYRDRARGYAQIIDSLLAAAMKAGLRADESQHVRRPVTPSCADGIAPRSRRSASCASGRKLFAASFDGEVGRLSSQAISPVRPKCWLPALGQ